MNHKDFKITNGRNLLSIGICEGGSYLYFKEPISVTINECSEPSNYILLPHNEEYRNEIHARIGSQLDEDFSNNPEALLEIVKSLFPLLKKWEL